jgi:hypothetical protein
MKQTPTILERDSAARIGFSSKVSIRDENEQMKNSGGSMLVINGNRGAV